ncbi:MAG: precorrin-3B synthase [Oscillatoriophycideae cyanobacterium NC_groundwater_1537_Pr4_S-0.65um_50_18]|nr:precorrin-3B synthase [Oscillatoriophycideae cyanobacterium NC_groundwater_1537_Pr4_S-0.65um_50_18]
MLSQTDACPGLFYATPAQDGILFRLRIPGGILTAQQCEAIALLSDHYGAVQVTNRANLQLRSAEALPNTVLNCLQQVGLAAVNGSTDHLRNIMASPTAGIDTEALIDTRPWVAQWNDYLAHHFKLAPLSGKFSVGFDGGEAVSIRDRPNDISLVAVKRDNAIYFRLHLSGGDRGNPPQPVNLWVKPKDSLRLLAALADLYCDYTVQRTSIPPDSVSSPPRDRHVRSPKPRFREFLQDRGIATVLQAVERRLHPACVLTCPAANGEISDLSQSVRKFRYLGSHPQQQPGLAYLGVALPLGWQKPFQIRGLSALAAAYGDSTLRLTPWQNLLIPYIPQPQLAIVQQGLEALQLTGASAWGAIVACAGTRGCKSAATDTQSHALALIDQLQHRISLDRPINIHWSGCEKSCAQHYPADITLMGLPATETALRDNGSRQAEAAPYAVYVGSNDDAPDQELFQEHNFERLLNLIEHMLRTYQDRRADVAETFRAFTTRHSLEQLRQLFSSPKFSRSKMSLYHDEP